MSWKKEYERTMNHTYLVISNNTYFEASNEMDYRLPMLLQNKIPGLLQVSHQSINGDNKLYYEISGLEALDEAFLKKEMDYKSVRELFAGCVNIYSNIEEYMLDAQQIILTPEYIFINPDTGVPQFVFYPEYGKDSRQSFVELIEYVLEKLNHTDESTVMLGYNLYRITRNKNFTMQEIENAIIESELTSENQVENEAGDNDEYLIEETSENENESSVEKEKFNPAKTLKKLKEKKTISPDKITVLQTPEITGMIASGIVMSLLTGFILYSISNNLLFVTDQIMMYLVGGVAMCFMTIIMLGYTYLKKRKQVLS